MASVEGYLDWARRPLVSITAISGKDRTAGGIEIPRSAREQPVLALLDSGFNGELWMEEAVATALGARMTNILAECELADRSRTVAVAQLDIFWFGEVITTAVFLTSSRGRSEREGEPVALLGMGLICPGTLKIDCAEEKVRISRERE